MHNLHYALFGRSSNPETNEVEWPNTQDLILKLGQEEQEPDFFSTFHYCQGKWRSKYPFFGLISGYDEKIEERLPYFHVPGFKPNSHLTQLFVRYSILGYEGRSPQVIAGNGREEALEIKKFTS